MDIANFTKEDVFELSVLDGGVYLGPGRLKNFRQGLGCPKCESLQAVLAFSLAWAGWKLWRAYG